ncbi:DUF3592 domain-containing protein [Kitasatospora sp. NPDC101447]|uniref:DUF3592 domain-containing protein n=1 Tax=Kitasatospora sp. NPDC101447 TaxID=3364102 RepID=UPI00382CC4B5
MSDGGVVWSVLGVVGSAAGVAALAAVVLRVRLRARILAQGLTAQARCLETFLTTETWGTGSERHTSTERHVIMGFRTADGRDVRFRDRPGALRVVGDRVPVRYLPERPQRVVTTDRHPSGVTAPLVAGAVAGLVVVAVGVLCAVAGLRGVHGEADAPAPLTSPGPQVPGHQVPDHQAPEPGWVPSGYPTHVVCTAGSAHPLCPGTFSGPTSFH